MMNIEDLIREANPVKTSDLAGADSPDAQRTLAQILRERALASPAHSRPLHLGRAGARQGRHSRRGRKRTLITVGLAAATAGATAAALILALPGAAHSPPPRSALRPSAHPRTAPLTTARQVLLTAAAHIASSPATGRYWRLREIGGITWPGGTKAHPYDISLSVSFDQWNPKSAGQKAWDIFQELGAAPATPADAAAWRAAGSPTRWHSGSRGFIMTAGLWHGELAATTAASAPGASWQVSDGTLGYVEGDEPGLQAAQFRQMPTSPRGVAAVLRRYYAATGCATHPGCSPEDQFIWSEALFLLQDPVSARVRSATFKVMASLPGVRLLGPVTDPLGRRGYALATDSLEPGGGNPNAVQVVVIDPRAGSLLATEDVKPMPGNVQCQTIGSNSAANKGKPIFKLSVPHRKPFIGRCVGPSYQGRSYPGQVDDYTALVSAGWTNASPAPPPTSTWEVATTMPGDPTLQFVPCDRTGC
jgi:hypothetical protein